MPKHGAMKTDWKNCARCGKQFVAWRPTQKYCSETCKRHTQWDRKRDRRILDMGGRVNEEGNLVLACTYCGREFEVCQERKRFCSPECRVAQSKLYQENYRKRVQDERKQQVRDEMEAERIRRAAKEGRRIVARARGKQPEEPITTNYIGCTAGYNLEELRAIGLANGLSYGKLTTIIACNSNEIPEGICVPDLTKLAVKGEGWKRRPIYR